MVPHSWILESVTLVGIADNIKRLLKNSRGNWITELNAYRTSLARNIQRRLTVAAVVRHCNNLVNSYAETV